MGKLQLPDLDGFMEEPMLPAAESEPHPLTGKEWDAMVKAAGKLADRELALVNQLLRVTGLRSAELVSLHESWLVQEGKGAGDRDPGPEVEASEAGSGGEGRQGAGAGVFPEGSQKPQGARAGGFDGGVAEAEGVSDRAGVDEYGPGGSGEPDAQCLAACRA